MEKVRKVGKMRRMGKKLPCTENTPAPYFTLSDIASWKIEMNSLAPLREFGFDMRS